MTRKFKVSLLMLAILILLADQASKYIARLFLVEGVSVNFLPHFDWTLAFNKGAAFSFLAQQDGWQRYILTFVSVFASAVLIRLIWAGKLSKLANVGLACILGGALGNLIDRAFIGKVTDFIDWYVTAYHWPAFNIADSFVCIGVVIVIIDNITNNNPKQRIF